MDDRWGQKSPFNSVYKLNEIVKVARSTGCIFYTLTELCDMVGNGATVPDGIGVPTLNGRGSGWKGLIHLTLYKRDALAHLFEYVNGTHGITQEFRKLFHDVFQTTATFREHFGYEGQVGDLTWISDLPESGRMLVRLAEDMQFESHPPLSFSTPTFIFKVLVVKLVGGCGFACCLHVHLNKPG